MHRLFAFLTACLVCGCASINPSCDGEPLDSLALAWHRDSPNELRAFPNATLFAGSFYMTQAADDQSFPGSPCFFQNLPDGRVLLLVQRGEPPWAILSFVNPPHGTFYESMRSGEGQAHAVGRFTGYEQVVLLGLGDTVAAAI